MQPAVHHLVIPAIGYSLPSFPCVVGIQQLLRFYDSICIAYLRRHYIPRVAKQTTFGSRTLRDNKRQESMSYSSAELISIFGTTYFCESVNQSNTRF
jgi:hypothetical protein